MKKMEKINSSLANVSLDAFCQDAEEKGVKVFEPYSFELYKDGGLYCPAHARAGCFVIARTEVVDFINKYRHCNLITYNKYQGIEYYFRPGMVPVDKCTYQIPHKLYVGKLNGSEARIKMPKGWLIVPINNLPCGKHDPVGYFVKEYEKACKTRNRNREWEYVAAKLDSFDY